MHPGFKMSLGSAVRIAFGLPMIDALEELLRKMRPYELEPGSADAAFDQAINLVMTGMRKSGVHGAVGGFKQAIDVMSRVRYDRSHPRPQVLIVGEYLLNFPPGANRNIEAYLEANGLEVIEARMTGRRVCGSCGASFHIVANPPKVDGVCDLCGAALTVRKDDAPETVKNRLKVFHAETEPLKDFYKKLGNLKLVEGNQPIEYATRDILAALGE